MSDKSKIVFLGCRDLGYRALEWILESGSYEVIGACLYPLDGHRYWSRDPRDLCEKYNIPEFSVSDLLVKTFDLGISVNYHELVPKAVLNIPQKGFWNIHHAYNLRLKGRNTITHAILNSKVDRIHYHGTTIHKMVEKLDVGPIAASRAVPIEENDTAYSLFNKLDNLALDLITEWLPRIAYEQVFTYEPPTEGIRMFKNSDLPEKKIDLNWNINYIHDFVRAFDFPGFEPAFYLEDEKKIHVVLSSREGYMKPLNVQGKIFYTQYMAP